MATCAFAIFNRVAPFLMQRVVTCNHKQYATKVACHMQTIKINYSTKGAYCYYRVSDILHVSGPGLGTPKITNKLSVTRNIK